MFADDPRVRAAQPLSLLPDVDQQTRRYGARSRQAVRVGDILLQHVPELASGELEIVAIARRVGVLSKVAVRQRLRVQPTRARPVLLVLGPAGERIRAVREALGHERVEIVQWHADPMRYVSAALGLSYLPSGRLYPVGRRAEILLGGIDYPAARGWHDLNLVLASALTSWQLAVEPIADSPNWHALELAGRDASAVPAEITSRTPKGLPVRVYDLNGLLPFGQIRGVKRDTSARLLEAEIGRVRRDDLKVKVLRMDADHGTIFVSERVPHGEQPRLPLL